MANRVKRGVFIAPRQEGNNHIIAINRHAKVMIFFLVNAETIRNIQFCLKRTYFSFTVGV